MGEQCLVTKSSDGLIMPVEVSPNRDLAHSYNMPIKAR